jgi:acetyltransferase-like isoleucine patch superfamily enzyme
MDALQERFREVYRFLAKSDAGAARAMRRLYWGIMGFSIPAPNAVFRPLLWGYLAGRDAYAFGKRVFICQPFLSAYATKVGKNLKTGTFVHWIQGHGDIILGDNVWIDGKCSISFASTFTAHPTLEIGDNTAIGHDTSFAIGKRITIGKNCNISGATAIFDSSGHPTDPVLRRERKPPSADDVRPVTIGDDVWIGKGCIVFPGVRIGSSAIVSAGSVVRRHVPPYAVVAGNPAQVIFRIPRPKVEAAAAMTAAPAPEVGADGGE